MGGKFSVTPPSPNPNLILQTCFSKGSLINKKRNECLLGHVHSQAELNSMPARNENCKILKEKKQQATWIQLKTAREKTTGWGQMNSMGRRWEVGFVLRAAFQHDTCNGLFASNWWKHKCWNAIRLQCISTRPLLFTRLITWVHS